MTVSAIRKTALVFQHLRFVELQKDLCWHPYEMIKVQQELYEHDFKRRKQFC